MLTLRFENHSSVNEAYQVFACEAYNVSTERCPPEGDAEHVDPKTAPLRKVVRMFRSLNDNNPYYETVGAREPHGVCYVMNMSGKTIDTIRGS